MYIKHIKAISFLKDFIIEEDFRGSSSANRYIAYSKSTKYFLKLVPNNIVKKALKTQKIYQMANISTAKIIKMVYLKSIKKTLIIYEYIEGKTIQEYLNGNGNNINLLGYSVGTELNKLYQTKKGKCYFKKEKFQNIEKLIENVYTNKIYYEKNTNKKLPEINLPEIFQKWFILKKKLRKSKKNYIHGDVNLNNIIIYNNDIYFIDNLDGKITWKGLDFRGYLWYGWQGPNSQKEKLFFKSLFQGLFQNKIPTIFIEELKFTFIYEFILHNNRFKNNLYEIERIFNVFNNILEITNNLENNII